MQRLRELYAVSPGEIYRPHRRHPPTILPAEEKGNIRVSDFTPIDSEEKLLALMDDHLASRRGIRVIGSGWSWNRILEADKRSTNVIFTGPLSVGLEVDAGALRATVSGGASICDFVFKCEQEGLDVDWPAKGFCFTPSESQTFAGFLATNVHHSHTPTAYEWVEAVRLAVFEHGRAVAVRACRQVRADLFESVFGGVGITGIILAVELRLRRAVRYDVRTERGRLRPHSLFGTASIGELLLRVTEPDTMLTINPAEGRFTVRVCPEAREPGKPAIVSSVALQQRGHEAKTLCCLPDLYDCLPWLLMLPCCACVPAALVCAGGFSNGARHRSGLAWDRSVVNWMEASLQADAIQEGSSLSLYQAHSWVWGRMYSVRRGRVAMTGESVHMDGLDLSLFVPLADWARFVLLAAPLIDAAPPLMIGVRFLPRAGGLLAANGHSAAVCIEFGGVRGMCGLFATQEKWLKSLLDAAHAQGFRLLSHPGKAFHPHPVFRDSLPASTRAELTRLRAAYDPAGVLDGGCVKFEQMYNLDPPGQAGTPDDADGREGGGFGKSRQKELSVPTARGKESRATRLSGFLV